MTRALVISPRMPPPPAGADFGGDKRLRVFVEGLAEVCDEFDFLYLVPETMLCAAHDPRFAAEAVWGVRGASAFAPVARREEGFVNHYVRGMLSARHVRSFFPFAGPACIAAVGQALASRPDLVFVHELSAMLPVLAARPSAPVLFDLVDLMDRTHWRAATAEPLRPGNVMYALQTPAILAAELRGIRCAARTTVCAPADRRFLGRLGTRGRVETVPNAVTAPLEPPALTDAPTVLFLGNYDYAPNVQAVIRLVERIWPLVRRARPDARLLLAGGSIERLPPHVSDVEGVEMLGFVPDIAALYARSKVVCCPIDVGGGTRLKLIEAGAYGRPMVSTRIGAENLEFRDGAEILLRDDDAGFAAACAELLSDHGRSTALGLAARERVRRLYDAGAVRAQVAALARSILAG